MLAHCLGCMRSEEDNGCSRAESKIISPRKQSLLSLRHTRQRRVSTGQNCLRTAGALIAPPCVRSPLDPDCATLHPVMLHHDGLGLLPLSPRQQRLSWRSTHKLRPGQRQAATGPLNLVLLTAPSPVSRSTHRQAPPPTLSYCPASVRSYLTQSPLPSAAALGV
jgi:hypothetical protein